MLLMVRFRFSRSLNMKRCPARFDFLRGTFYVWDFVGLAEGGCDGLTCGQLFHGGDENFLFDAVDGVCEVDFLVLAVVDSPTLGGEVDDVFLLARSAVNQLCQVGHVLECYSLKNCGVYVVRVETARTFDAQVFSVNIHGERLEGVAAVCTRFYFNVGEENLGCVQFAAGAIEVVLKVDGAIDVGVCGLQRFVQLFAGVARVRQVLQIVDVYAHGWAPFLCLFVSPYCI